MQVSNNIFIKSLKFSGFPIAQALTDLSEMQSLSAKDFLFRREQLRSEIFIYHFENNTFYRDFILKTQNKAPESWDEIPVLTKNHLQKPLEQLLSDAYSLKDVYINNTSGSSGVPLYYAKDKYCHAITWALVFNRYLLHDIHYGKSLQARFFGIPLSKKKFITEKIKDKLSARIRFPVFDLSDEVLERFLAKIYKHNFEYLYGYANSLLAFARFLNNQGINLKDNSKSLKITISTSEMLHPTDRLVMEKAFGVPVINEYGSAEFGILAFENECFDWITSDENLWLEIVDENDKILPFGKEGRIIITSLFNKAMPFIRYEVGDIGSLAMDDNGRYHVIKSIQGRTNDFAILPSGKKSPGLTFYYVTKSLMESSGDIKEFAIRQLAKNHFHFEYVSDHHLSEKRIKKIQESMDIYLEPGLKATFEKVSMIQRTRAGKLKNFESFV